MRVLSIANYKGGCGKTSTAVNLGACLAQQGKKVLVIDLDPQLSATSWLGLQMDSKGLHDVFTGDETLESCVMDTNQKGLFAIPGSRWLISLDKELAQEIGPEGILREKIKQLPENWDFILLDCSPSTGILSLNSLSASDDLIIPLEPTVLNTGGLVHMIKTVERVRDRLNSKLQIMGILPCRVDNRTKLSKEIVSKLRDKFGDMIFKTVIRDTVKMKECASFGCPITEYDPKGKSTEDYRKLAKEVIKKVGKHVKV